MSETTRIRCHWKTADPILYERMVEMVGLNRIENDDSENRFMVDLVHDGANMDGCGCTYRGKRDAYSALAWTACPVIQHPHRRTIYRGTLYQCAVARDCFRLLREPFSPRPYGSRPGEKRESFFLTKEEDITARLSGDPVLRQYFEWLIQRFVEQGLLKPRAVKVPSGPTIRKEKPVPGLQMQAILRERLDELYTRLEGIEQLLSEQQEALSVLSKNICCVSSGLGDLWNKLPAPPETGHVLLDPTNEAGMLAALSNGGTPAPENTKEWPAGEYPYTPAPENTKEPAPEFGIDAL